MLPIAIALCLLPDRAHPHTLCLPSIPLLSLTHTLFFKLNLCHPALLVAVAAFSTRLGAGFCVLPLPCPCSMLPVCVAVYVSPILCACAAPLCAVCPHFLPPLCDCVCACCVRR